MRCRPGRAGPGLAARRVPHQLAERPSGKKQDRLPIRVSEHSALVPGPDGDEAAETCTLITSVLRSGCPQLVLQEAQAWLTGTHLVRSGEAAAVRGGEAAARAPRRKSARPVTADEESWPEGPLAGASANVALSSPKVVSHADHLVRQDSVISAAGIILILLTLLSSAAEL